MHEFKHLLAGILFSLLVVSTGSCVYDEITPREVVTPDTVLFGLNIVPIFTANCSLSGCHVSTGGIPPDLSPDNAYISLIFFNYINKDIPEESQLLNEITDGSMKIYASDEDRALILKWVEQGALEN